MLANGNHIYAQTVGAMSPTLIADPGVTVSPGVIL